MIIKRRGKYMVMDKAGDKLLGMHGTRTEALQQIAAIEASKHRRGK